jgi:hypothetical protein
LSHADFPDFGVPLAEKAGILPLPLDTLEGSFPSRAFSAADLTRGRVFNQLRRMAPRHWADGNVPRRFPSGGSFPMSQHRRFGRRSKSAKSATNRNLKRKGSNSGFRSRGVSLGVEQLESRWVLSANPILTAAGDQIVNEGALLNLAPIGTFTDVVDGGGSGGDGIGLDPTAYTSLANASGAFHPLTGVQFNTDTLTFSGGMSGSGTMVSANTGNGSYQIAVFAFTDFDLDSGITVTAVGSRPLALLSLSDVTIGGTIDVSATFDPSTANQNNRIAGPGGGNGGLGAFSNSFTAPPFNPGSPALGAPANSVGNPFPDFFAGFSGGGGTGAGHGGNGGRAEGQQASLGGVIGHAYGDLALGIQGGSGGGTSGGEEIATNSHWVAGGGGGGGGLELGAVGVLQVSASGLIRANGGEGAQGINVLGVGSGGGGAGGGILLHAHDVNQFGNLTANGGAGGINGEKSGGGGAGGSIMIVHSASGSYNDTGSESVLGGQPWFNGSLGGEAGQSGAVAVISETLAAPIIENYSYTISWGDASTNDTGAAIMDPPPGVNIGDPIQGHVNGSHTYADDGVYTVSLTVSDNNGGTQTKTFQVTVNNVAPLNSVDSASVTVNEGVTASNSGSFSDVPADTVSLSASIGTVIDNGDGTWSWSFNSSDGPADSQEVTITANDGDGGLTDVSFQLNVNNVAPQIAVASSTVAVNEGSTATNGGTLSDVPADTVSLSASIGLVVNNGDGTWSWSYSTADGPGDSQLVTITASDEDGGSSDISFQLVVSNAAPQIAVAAATVTVNEGAAATNGGSLSDVPADTVSLLASIGAVVNNGNGTWSWSFNAADGPGDSQTVTITASDEDGGSSSVSFQLVVNNVAPTANAGGPYLTFDDTPIVLNGSATDPAGASDPLTYVWDLDGDGVFGETGSGAARGNEVGANPTYTPAVGVGGTFTVKLQVNDGDGGVTTVATTVQVLKEGVLLIGDTLYVVGNATASDLVLITQCNNTIQVFATFNSDNPASFNASAITSINVRLRGGNDVLVTTPNVMKPMTIDGGTGNDLLTGGGGANLIMGGDGCDVLYGSCGNDTLLGGAGNDDLIGGSGDDILVGGAGADMIYGGEGRDLLIGGLDGDHIEGGGEDDILVGGYTSHDNDVAALDSIMAIWGSSASFSARVSTLTGSGGLLQAGVTVFDDDSRDDIIGNSGRDLAFGDTSRQFDNVKDSTSLKSAEDVLVALN